MSLPQENKRYTYADYLTWPENERWEIIDGVPYLQAAPTWQHQSVLGNIFAQFHNYFRNKPCRVFAAPFDLRIPEADESDEETTLVVQPDITVVCDESRLSKTGYFGTPKLIIEISSPSTARNDKLLKFNRYEKAGVEQYWVVEPENKLVSVFSLQDNKRFGRPDVYSDEDIIHVSIFHALEIDLKIVFNDI